MDNEERRKCTCEENMNNNQVVNNNQVMNNMQAERDNCMQEQMLMEIRELNFAVIELSLYLNTHPEDQRALCLHRKYAKELRDLTDKYQKVYGPLSIYYPCNKWRWLEEPWPWERGNN